jgi:hypothetical protein
MIHSSVFPGLNEPFQLRPAASLEGVEAALSANRELRSAVLFLVANEAVRAPENGEQFPRRPGRAIKVVA